jgi:hypothetical protein
MSENEEYVGRRYVKMKMKKKTMKKNMENRECWMVMIIMG